VLYGGIEQMLDSLARGLVAAGHEVMLFTTADSTCPVPRQWLLEHAEGQRMGFSVPELRHVMAAYEAVEGFDIVHDHTVLGPLVAAGQAGHPPVVTTIHGPLNEELIDLYGRIAQRVPVIAISHAQRTPAPEIPFVRVIHHGYNANDFPIGRGDGGYCLFLGRMATEKGPQRAIIAARKAGMPILLAGKLREPWEKEFFDRDVAPLLGADAEFLGEVDHAEKVRLLAGASATLFPIRWNEPFGLVMLESLACGTPVISFAEGASPEVIEDGRTGFLCGDEAEMAEALSRIDTIDRSVCRAAVEGQFSSQRMVADHVELYSELVG